MAATPQLSVRPLPRDFERIFRDHHALVYRAAYRITGNAEDAEDVLQTLFLRLLRRESPPEIQNNPKSYLHRAAVNIALDILKTRKRHMASEDEALQVEDKAPLQDRSGAEVREWLRAALAELSPKTAEIFVLRHVEGYDNSEIAKMLGTSRSTVGVLLFRARARLKKSVRIHFGERL
ncbi:MAG: sigma-70 family RNA polymerase sigma factor [Acidobacteria bacterium]|nr:sigma-70 family RNA polymerase sigma factor [Acidobacteriota bacterium]